LSSVVNTSVEVIIPVRNMAEHLPKVLGPLRAQFTGDDVVTVIDDASTDDTAAVARSLGAKVVSLTESRGPYYARQIVARRSAADILLFIDGRCRPLPGLIDAHRELQSRPGVALSCTDVRTLSGPTPAARVAALLQPFSVPTRGAVPGKPPYYPTANLGIDRTAFESVGGFRAMRSGGDADICWRIQEQGLGTMAVDPRILMEWEPRTSVRELARQWKRYGRGTAYLRWAYRMDPVAQTAAKPSIASTLSSALGELRTELRKSPAQLVAGAAINVMFQYGYHAEKRKRSEFTMPKTYDLTST
jgi:glycosyltransferase involved in cell wall biosynthesis